MLLPLGARQRRSAEYSVPVRFTTRIPSRAARPSVRLQSALCGAALPWRRLRAKTTSGARTLAREIRCVLAA